MKKLIGFEGICSVPITMNLIQYIKFAVYPNFMPPSSRSGMDSVPIENVFSDPLLSLHFSHNLKSFLLNALPPIPALSPAVPAQFLWERSIINEFRECAG